MGIVWEAESLKDKRRVVVKEPLINKDHDQIKIERLLIEAAVLRTINDELTELTSDENQRMIRANVVRYVDQLTDPQHPLLVLEFLEGLTISTAYRGKPVTEAVAVQRIVTLLKVVRALHSKGVIHRDISPSNIILSSNRGLVLIDFGTSLILSGAESSRSSQSGRIVFKRGFSAPELFEGRSDERSDIFSVGATMFYLLTGKNPADFMGNSHMGLTRLPSDINKSISAVLSETVQHAMTADPARRFRSIPEMLDSVESRLIRPEFLPPIVSIGGMVYELNNEVVDIGREHSCDDGCKTLIRTNSLQIKVTDPQKYVEKHHVRIWVGRAGGSSIEDLRTVNRTAIKHREHEFEILTPSKKERLHDKDIVALAYSPTRGPYLTFEFRER